MQTLRSCENTVQSTVDYIFILLIEVVRSKEVLC